MLAQIRLYLYKRSLRKQLKSLIYSGKIEKITFVSMSKDGVDGDRISVYKLSKKSNEGEKK